MNDNQLKITPLMICQYPVECNRWQAVVMDTKMCMHMDTYAALTPEHAAFRAKQYCIRGEWAPPPRKPSRMRKARP